MKYKFGAPAYAGYCGMVGVDGNFFSIPQGCKDWVPDSLTHHFYPKYAQQYSVCGGYANLKNPPDLDRPEFVCSLNGNAQSFMVNFLSVVNDLEGLIGLKERTEAELVVGNTMSKPFYLIARAHPFWIKTPIAVSFLLSIMRSSPTIPDGSAFWPWMNLVMEFKSGHAKDTGYLRVAHFFGNIEGFIAKTLKCMNREGYSDWLLSNHSRGIGWYDNLKDNAPMTEKELIQLRIEGPATPASRWGATSMREMYYDVTGIPENVKKQFLENQKKALATN